MTEEVALNFDTPHEDRSMGHIVATVQQPPCVGKIPNG
jgi:hypothetical protein